MSSVNKLLCQIESGDPSAADQLLLLVSAELRQLVATHLPGDWDDQTFKPAALVNQAYRRLVAGANPDSCRNWGRFFGVAAVAIRRILVDNARMQTRPQGPEFAQRHFDKVVIGVPGPNVILALDAAMSKFSDIHPQAAELVQLLFFGGLTLSEAAKAMEMSPRTTERFWEYARGWLRREIQASDTTVSRCC